MARREIEEDLLLDDGDFRKVPDELLKLMKAATEDRDEYGWLQHDFSDNFFTRAEKAEAEYGEIEWGDDLTPQSNEPTLRELAATMPLTFKCRNGEEATVYMVGTDHNTRGSAEDVIAVCEEVKPDLIAAEGEPEFEHLEQMQEMWTRFEGDVAHMAKVFTSGDKSFQHEMRVVGHVHRDDPYSAQILKWGTFLSCDIGAAAYMAAKLDTPMKWLDVSERAHERKCGPVWAHVAMHTCLKKIFGIDCTELNLDIEQIYQLLASLEVLPVHVMAEDQNIEGTLAPDIHVLGTHTRDLYMCQRLHQLCEANPGKTIVAVMGAFHSLNIRELWDRRIPQALTQVIGSDQKSRKQLQKVFKKYGGCAQNGRCRCVDWERFPKRG